VTSRQHRADLAAKIAAELGDVRVVVDARDVNPPCVLIGAPAGLDKRTVCNVYGTVPVMLIAPPPGNADALDWCLDTLDALVATLTVNGLIEPATFTLPGGQELPAYTIPVAFDNT